MSWIKRQRETYQAKSLLFRTSVVTGGMVLGTALFLGGVTLGVGRAAQAVLHSQPDASAAKPAGSAGEEALATERRAGDQGAPATALQDGAPGSRKKTAAKRPTEPRAPRGEASE